MIEFKCSKEMLAVEKFDSKILSSCYINFLFGAGVNGDAFPQAMLFTETLEFMKNKVKKDDCDKPFEELFNLLQEEDKKEARKLFIKEFKSKHSNIDFDNQSIKNIKEMIRITYRLVYESENRKEAMNQINIFTTNYDFIVEDSAKDLGYLCNYVSASNLQSHDRFFNIVGRDFSLKREVPTFFISKIHGDISDPVLPGVDKYDSILTTNKFEIVFKMKEKLSRDNSILFVIGYSGRDGHINRILKDCVDSGLTIYWFKYKKEDIVPKEIEGGITILENKDGDDTTALFTRKMRELWDESLEK